jgi:hypothetical protein
MDVIVSPDIDQAASARRQGAEWRPGEFALRNAWFAVAHQWQVGTNPVRRAVHSQPIFLWRDPSGRVAAAEHHPEQPAAQRTKATEFTDGTGFYPLIELYGYVWVWYGNPGNADPELIPDIPFLPRHRMQPRYASDTNFFHCSYELVLENVLDLTHLDFVHGNFAGHAESEDDRITFESTSETVTLIRTVKKKPTSKYHREVLGITTPYQDHWVFCHVHLRSGMCFLHSSHTVSPSMPLMQTNTPESRTLTRANVVFGIQQCDNPGYRRTWPTTGPAVAAQDESVLRPQNPRYLFQDGGVDLSSRFDAAGLHYRTRHLALVKRQKADDFSYLPDYFAGPDIAELFRLKRIN